MALARKISKEIFDKLAAEIQKEYKKDGDDYSLDVEGEDDYGALSRAKDREKEAARKLKDQLKEAEDRIAALTDENEGSARRQGDIKTLENSWKEKLEKQKKEDKDKIDKLSGHIRNTLVDAKALELATKLSPKNAKVLLPHIKARLIADMDGDEPATRVLDAAGKPSALSVDDLHAEFVANKDFSGIIDASKASGGAGQPSRQAGSAPNASTTPVNLADLSPKDLGAQMKQLIESRKAEGS
jgi:hypothetical protein